MSEIDRLYRRFVRTGDREALAALYDRVAPDLLLVASNRLGDANAAEDAVHNAFMSVIERRGQHDESRPVRPWLMGAVINQGRMHLRADARRVDPRRTEPSAPADPGEVAAAEELVRAVHESVARLPDTYRTVLDLRLRRGLAPHEIAARLDRPAATVRSQLARGLAEVRRALPPGFAATVTVLVASEASAAAGRAATLTAAGAVSAGSVAMFGAPIKLGAICFAVGLAVALPLAILAGTVPVVDPLLVDTGDSIDLQGTAAVDPDVEPAAALPAPGNASASGGPAAGRPAAKLAASPALAQDAAATDRWILVGKVTKWIAALNAKRPPVAGCRVQLHLAATALSDGPRNEPFAETVTDEDGRYQVDLNALRKLDPQDLAGLELRIFAQAPGLAGESSLIDIPNDPRRSYRGRDEMSLQPGAVLRGRVVAADGRPVRDGYAGFADSPSDGAVDEYELVDGHYQLIVLEPGRVLVRAIVPGRGVSRVLPVDVRDFETYSLPDLVLEEGQVIDTRAVYADGSPARDLLLSYHAEKWPRESRWSEHGTVMTDADGGFRLADLGEQAYLFEPDLDFDDKTRVRLEPGRPATRGLLRIRSPVIVVRVRDHLGQARTNVPLRLLGWSGAHADRAQAVWNAGGDLHALSRDARHYGSWTVDRRGGILSFAVPAGSFWVIRSQLPGRRAVERAVRVTPGRFEHRVDLLLEPLRDAGRLRIAVRDPAGRPIDRFTVKLAPGRTGIPLPGLAGNVIGAGRELTGLTPGRYRLTVVPLQGRLRTDVDRRKNATLLPVTQVIEVRPGANLVKLDTELGARLALRLHIPPAKQPVRIPWCDIRLSDAAGARRLRGLRFYEIVENGGLRQRERFPTDGRPLMLSHRFRPGTQRIRLRFEGYEPAEVVIPFEAGRLHEATLRLQPASVTPARAPHAPHPGAGPRARG